MNAHVKSLKTERTKLLGETKALADALATADRGLTVEEAAADDARASRIAAIDSELDRYTRIENASLRITGGEPVVASKPYESFGQQLIDVIAAEVDHQVAPRLNKLNEMAAASGLNTGVAADGGYLVQQDFSSSMLQQTWETGQFLGKVNRLPVSANSNGTKIPAIDETSRANGSRYGGLQVYWLEEAGTPTATKPKVRQLELNLRKVVGLCYVTEEMLADAPLLSAYVQARLPEELTFTVEDACFSGNGAGKPLGFLNSPALLTVGIEAGQTIANGAFKIENAAKMFAALAPRSVQKAAWYINSSLLPYMVTMKVGDTPVFMSPGNGATQAPFGTLFGRPIFPVEYCSAVGTPGDVILADPSAYSFIDKGGIKAESSIHVRFLQGETAFRFMYRCDGQSEWAAKLTAKDGSTQFSPFVVLDTRS